MSIISHLRKHAFIYTFGTLFVGVHYGWHLLQLQDEINLGAPPKELPATIFAQYLARKVHTMINGENAPAGTTATAAVAAADKQ